MKVICINSSNKPLEIPDNQWVELGETYTVTQIIALPLQPGKTGFLLKEVSLSPECFPYEFYSSDRFAQVVGLEEEAVEVQEEEFAI